MEAGIQHVVDMENIDAGHDATLDTIALLPSEVLQRECDVTPVEEADLSVTQQEESTPLEKVPDEAQATDLQEDEPSKTPQDLDTPTVRDSPLSACQRKGILVAQKLPEPSPHFHLACLAMACFWPVGYFSLVNAALCRSAIAHGNIPAAIRLSRDVRRASRWAIGLGFLCVALSIVAVVITKV